MRPFLPTAPRVWCVAAFCSLMVAFPYAQETPPQPATHVSVAIGSRSPSSDVAAVDARIAAMVAAGQLVRRPAVSDPLIPGRTHEYFAQVHAGVPVLGGGLSRQRDGERTVSVFGTIYLDIVVPTDARPMGADRAVRGLRGVSTTSLAPGDVPLVVLPQFDGSYRLIYQATFRDGTVRSIDALTGDLVRTEDAFVTQGTVGTGTGAHGDVKKVSASRATNGYEAVDQMRPARIRTRSTQGTNVPRDALFEGAGETALSARNVWEDRVVVDAHVNAGLAYDYFNQQQGWEGLDGRNALIDQVVTDGATIQNNAFFAYPAPGGNVGLIAFGMSSTGYPMATLDIVGHEMMHGVTFFSVRGRTGTGLVSAIAPDGLGPSEVTLNGQRLPCTLTVVRFDNGAEAPMLCVDGRYVLASNAGGAINEGFSDVFGTAIEFQFQPPGRGVLRADYLNGEDVTSAGSTASPQIGRYRSLEDPMSVPLEPTGTIRQPDHIDGRVRYPVYVLNNQAYLLSYAIADGRLVPVSPDSGAVHHNSTILSHVFYRAIEGGTHRTSGRTVAGVGAGNRAIIERVFFRAMTTLMPALTSFEATAAVLRQAASDLEGPSSAAYRAIDEALAAAGL